VYDGFHVPNCHFKDVVAQKLKTIHLTGTECSVRAMWVIPCP